MVVPIRNSTGPELAVSDEQKAALVGQILRGELTPREACETEGLSEVELKRWVRAYTRAARRAVDDQVAAALAAHGLEVDDRPASEFSGNLDSMGLSELIQTIQYGKKDAQIRIEHDAEQSQLWCIEGDVVDAASAALTGSAAVYRILSLARGRLHADFAPVQRARSIHASTQALLLEAAQRADECRQIRGRLGAMQDIYVPSASAPPESEIEPDQASVLAAFDGHRSLEQVVHDSEFPDLETLGMIARLLEQEWLVRKPAAPLQRVTRRVTRPPAPARESSLEPLAASLASRLSLRGPPPRLWASAGAGVIVVAGAFAIGFYSALASDSGHEPALGAAASPPVACGANLVALPGGLCLDRAEVTAGEYQACVRSGACEPVQREFDGAPSVALNAALSAPPSGPPGSPAGESSASLPSGPPPASSGPLISAEPHQPPPAAAEAAGARDERTAHCNAGLAGRESYSVNCLTFVQARRYCEWRGGRLPTRSEWEQAASLERPLGVEDLPGGLSEWTFEPASAGSEGPHDRVDLTRDRVVVLGGSLETGAGTAGALRRLYMNANAQGRSVGFRCVVQADPPPGSPVAANREPAPGH